MRPRTEIPSAQVGAIHRAMLTCPANQPFNGSNACGCGPANGNVTCANESLLVLKFIAELFDGPAAEFTKVARLPFAPVLVAKKVVERSLVALGV